MPFDLKEFEVNLRKALTTDEPEDALTVLLMNTLQSENVTSDNKGVIVRKYLEIWRCDASPIKNIRVNLSWTDLSGTDLSGADLYGANLSGADLRCADLSGAYLSWANLSGADLRGADLKGADLIGADLTEASLERADLYRAYLAGTNPTNSILIGSSSLGSLSSVCNFNMSVTTVDELSARINSIIANPTAENLKFLPNLYAAASAISQSTWSMQEWIKSAGNTVTSSYITPEQKEFLGILAAKLQEKFPVSIIQTALLREEAVEIDRCRSLARDPASFFSVIPLDVTRMAQSFVDGGVTPKFSPEMQALHAKFLTIPDAQKPGSFEKYIAQQKAAEISASQSHSARIIAERAAAAANAAMITPLP